MTEFVPQPVAKGMVIPEGPRWHDGALWLSDIGGHRVLRIDASGNVETITDAVTMPSGLGFLPGGDPLVVAMDDRKLYRLTPDGPTVHADLKPFCTGMLNDMIVDRHGRAYVDANGHSFFKDRNEEPRTPDRIVLVHPDGTAEVAADNLAGPNGMIVTEDGRTLISAESSGARLTAFDVEDDGSLTNQRVFADLNGTAPDGICLDAEGAVWVAAPVVGEFLRVKEGGEITDRIPVPGRVALACVLGGSDRRTLFLMTAAPHDLGLLREHKTEGGVERLDVAVAGTGRP